MPRYGIGEGVKKSMQSSPKVTIKNGFPTGRRAAALAGIYWSPRQSFDQIRRRVFGAPAHQNPITENKKACFLSLGRSAVFTTAGPKMPKQASVALAVICYALCKLTSKSAQPVF
jgi:hypothetical protein